MGILGFLLDCLLKTLCVALVILCGIAIIFMVFAPLFLATSYSWTCLFLYIITIFMIVITYELFD